MVKQPRGWPSAVEVRLLRLLREHGELYGHSLLKVAKGTIQRGSVYVFLIRMQKKGFIESRVEPRPAGYHGMFRRFYRITARGECVAALADAMDACLSEEP